MESLTFGIGAVEDSSEASTVGGAITVPSSMCIGIAGASLSVLGIGTKAGSSFGLSLFGSEDVTEDPGPGFFSMFSRVRSRSHELFAVMVLRPKFNNTQKNITR